ncbi:hypothetical protein [Streptomyces sp. NPDC005805]|uniref:hypothetical protein n=1 Tax=Streptomyces sp. NPDC005805 TaxID=3157068 RepID=UPI0033CE0C7D
MSTPEPAPTGRDPRTRRAGRTGPVLFGVGVGILLTVVCTAVLWWPRSEVTFRNSAPASVAYEDESAHHLGLVHEHTLSGRSSYRLVIGRDPGLSYGHWVGVDSTTAAEGVEATTWTADGVRVRFATGHEVFVPARYFLHGR